MPSFNELPLGSCYQKRRARYVRKKASGAKYVSIGKRGLRKGKERGSANVNPVSCPLDLLGVGLKSKRMDFLELGCSTKKRKKK